MRRAKIPSGTGSGLWAGGRVVRGEGNREVETVLAGKVQDALQSSSSVREDRLEGPRAGKPLRRPSRGSGWSVRASAPPCGSPASARERSSVSPLSPAERAFGSSAVVSPQVAMDLEGNQNGRAGKNFLKVGKKR